MTIPGYLFYPTGKISRADRISCLIYTTNFSRFSLSGIRRYFNDLKNPLQILPDKRVVMSLVSNGSNRPVTRIHSSFIGQP